MNAEQPESILTRRVILTLLLGGLVLLSYAVLRIFLVPMAWAAILAFSTWPIYTRLQRLLGTGNTLSALLMTVLLTAAFVLPLLWLVMLLRSEVAVAYAAVTEQLAQGPAALPGRIAQVPWLGDWLQQALDLWVYDPAALRAQIAEWLEARTGEILNILGDVGRNAGKLGLALVTVFFLYRDGEALIRQAGRILRRFLGQRADGYISAAAGMTKAVVWGLVATALVQGLVAGLGYWWAGVAAPVLLGATTAMIAMMPFGAPFVWAPIAAWLMFSGDLTAGIGLLIWGLLVVSWVDNLIRPLLISTATRVPFLLAMFGVLGGLAAFGLIGLFLGPVILAVLVAVWREWLDESRVRMPSARAADHESPRK